MNPRAALLAGSLLANAALVGFVFLHPSIAPPAIGDFLARHFHDSNDASVAPNSIATAPAPSPTPYPLWPALQTEDLVSFVSRLRAAGFPPDVTREIVRARVNARYKSRLAALMAPDPRVPFWKAPPGAAGDPKRAAEINRIERERSELLRELLAGDFFASDDVTAAQRRQFGNLSRSKIDALQRIEDDYAEMISRIKAGMNGIILPGDRDALALIDREKQADLTAVLTPEELTDYTIRSSPITNLLRSRFGSFDPTEREFRAILQLQLALNEKFPARWVGSAGSAEELVQRLNMMQQSEDQVKTSLGEARYAEYSRAGNDEFRQLSRLAQSDGLPDATAVQAFNLRDQVAGESNRIFDDSILDVDQKRAALRSLAQNTRAQLLATLGPTSGPAYVKIAERWLANLDRGAAFTFNAGLSYNYAVDGTPKLVSNSGILMTSRSLPTPPAAPRP